MASSPGTIPLSTTESATRINHPPIDWPRWRVDQVTMRSASGARVAGVGPPDPGAAVCSLGMDADPFLQGAAKRLLHVLEDSLEALQPRLHLGQPATELGELPLGRLLHEDGLVGELLVLALAGQDGPGPERRS